MLHLQLVRVIPSWTAGCIPMPLRWAQHPHIDVTVADRDLKQQAPSPVAATIRHVIRVGQRCVEQTARSDAEEVNVKAAQERCGGQGAG